MDTMVLIASPRHPLARRKPVTMADLSGEPFILHHHCATTERMILRMFETQNIHCNIAAELWSFENIKEFVMNDVGLAIIPGICAMREPRAGTLARLQLHDWNLERETFMIFPNQGYLSESSRQFIRMMKQGRTLPDVVRKIRA